MRKTKEKEGRSITFVHGIIIFCLRDINVVFLKMPTWIETIFAVNRNIKENATFKAGIRDFEGYTMDRALALEGTDMKAVNLANEEKVKPHERKDVKPEKGELCMNLLQESFATIVLSGKE